MLIYLEFDGTDLRLNNQGNIIVGKDIKIFSNACGEYEHEIWLNYVNNYYDLGDIVILTVSCMHMDVIIINSQEFINLHDLPNFDSIYRKVIKEYKDILKSNINMLTKLLNTPW